MCCYHTHKTLFLFRYYQTDERNYGCIEDYTIKIFSEDWAEKLQGKNEKFPTKNTTIQPLFQWRRQKPVTRLRIQSWTRQMQLHKLPTVSVNVSNFNFLAGGLANKINEWEKITSDLWILSTVFGYKIEFEDIPIQYKDISSNQFQ